jgi:hypothetical protein
MPLEDETIDSVRALYDESHDVDRFRGASPLKPIIYQKRRRYMSGVSELVRVVQADSEWQYVFSTGLNSYFDRLTRYGQWQG